MSLRDQVALAYDDERGLRCLPRCVKEMFRHLLERLGNESLPLLAERLRRVEQYIEPLCVETSEGGAGPLQALCEDLNRASSLSELAGQMGVLLPEEPDAIMWLRWGDALQMHPGSSLRSSLIAVGLWWAQPWPIEEYPADVHAIAYILSADALRFLSAAAPAAQLLESFLKLVPADYSDAQRLGSALTRADSPLPGLEADTRASLIRSLAMALEFVPARGCTQPPQLLETFLKLLPEDFSDAQRLGTALTRADSPLPGLDAKTRASLICSLAGALRFAPGRGYAQAALLVETFLKLVPGDYSDAQRLGTALTRADSPLAGLEANYRANMICSLAVALGFVLGRGCTHSARLLETFLGLMPGDYSDAQRLGTALTSADSPLPELEVNSRASLIRCLASALRGVPGRGASQAVLLLVTFLRLVPGDFSDAQRLRTALTRAASPLAGLAANNRANLILSLAVELQGVPGRGCTFSALLLETFLELVPGDYGDTQRMGAALTRADSPLPELEVNSRAGLISILANALKFVPGRGNTQAALLLETFLKLVPGDYNDAERLGTAPTRADSPLAGLATINRACLIESLARALGGVPGREIDGLCLLEEFADGDIASLAAGETATDLIPLTRLGIVHVWLKIAPAWGRATESTCAAAVRFIRRLRNEHLGSQSAVEEFFSEARKLWGEIQQATLAEMGSATEEGRTRREQKLLFWAEQFENRLLFERLLSQGMPAGDGATELTNWEPGRWGLRSPWDEVSVRKRVSQWYPGRRNEIAAVERGSAGFISPTACCLRQQPIPLQPRGVPVGSPGSHDLARERSLPALPEWQLHDLLPTSAVWIRAYFDSDDRLRWSAWRSTGSDLVRLAGGASAQPQARQRLSLANLAFDLAVERVWLQATANPQASFTFTLAPLVQLGQEIHQRCLVGTPIDRQMTEALHGALQRLGKAGHSTLASLGSALLNDDYDTNVAAKLELLQIWQTELQALQAWNRYGKKAGQDDERRAALDTASREHVAALQAELDLAPLWDATGHEFPWSDTDLLLQLPGPALAMPAAWLDLGGEPLFRRMASTSSVVSLTFRHLAAEEAAKQPAIDPHLLSAQWEEPTDRHDAIGLAYLHHRLHALPQVCATTSEPASRWNVWSLGDDPELQIDHLQRALGGAQRFGVVVLGGHGSAVKAGIQLSDGHANPGAPRVVWCGEGANLHGVDLLVLVSCAVGRLNQQGDRDVEGMYVQLAGQGARCVLAARWPISDLEGAELTAEFVERYIRGLGTELRPRPFARARAFNAARCELLDHGDPTRRVTFHQAAAFELYGLG